MIRAEKIYKSFGDLQVLKGIDLEVNKGEIVSIVGPSGAGSVKSKIVREQYASKSEKFESFVFSQKKDFLVPLLKH